MRRSGLAFLLAAPLAFVLIGCTDDPAPVAGVGTTEVPNALGKPTVISFTATESLVENISPGEAKFVGGRMIITGMVDVDRIVATSPYMDCLARITFNASFDANMEGPIHGTCILTPVPAGAFGGGVWEGTFTGYQSMTAPGEYTVHGKQVGHGRGGTLEGMKHMVNSVYVDGVGSLTGEITLH